MRWRSSSPHHQADSMRWLCLDPGDKRTGVAVSSPDGTFAIPVAVLEHARGGPAPKVIEELLSEHEADALLIGLPVSMDGSPSSQTNSALELAHRVATHFGTRPTMPPGIALPHIATVSPHHELQQSSHAKLLHLQLWDERLSSWDARRAMGVGNSERRARRGRKHSLDAHAATVILQSFLSTQRGEQPPRRDPNTDTWFKARRD